VNANVRLLRAVTAAAAFAGVATAQIPRPMPGGYQPYTSTSQGQAGMAPSAQGQGSQPQGAIAPQQPFVPGTQSPGASNPFLDRWNQQRPLQATRGFPIFPSQFSALGGYATTPDLATSPTASMFPAPAPAVDDPMGWPAWARLKTKEPLPFAPDAALLIRHAERVWFQSEAAEPLVPLAFHDKLRGLKSGASVQVRSIGEFELLLHNTSRLIARGPTRLHLDELAADKVTLRVPTVSWLRIATTGRAHAIALPGGGTLGIAAPAPSLVPSFLPAPVPMSAPLPGVTDVVIDRLYEPGWLGGRATLTNLGSTTVTWRHHAGDVEIAPGQRMVFFVSEPDSPLPAELALGAAARVDDGAAVVCRATQDTVVGWSGAAFPVPKGASVRFEPQSGRPFAAAPAKAAGTGRP
jgi:hypothetical protein